MSPPPRVDPIPLEGGLGFLRRCIGAGTAPDYVHLPPLSPTREDKRPSWCPLGWAPPHTTGGLPQPPYKQAAIRVPPPRWGCPTHCVSPPPPPAPAGPIPLHEGSGFLRCWARAGGRLRITGAGTRGGPLARQNFPPSPVREAPAWAAGCPVALPLVEPATPPWILHAPSWLSCSGRRGMGRTPPGPSTPQVVC